MSKIIQLSKFKKKDNSLVKLSVNSDYYISKSNSLVYMSNEETNKYISNNALVSFIIDYGIKAQESDSETYIKEMLKHHICITFYGINYYLKFNEFDKERQRIFDYLNENYSSDKG